jgi:hypothetical protein
VLELGWVVYGGLEVEDGSLRFGLDGREGRVRKWGGASHAWGAALSGIGYLAPGGVHQADEAGEAGHVGYAV